jgi:hypothetical protein
MYRIIVQCHTLARSGKAQDTKRIFYRACELICPTLEIAHKKMEEEMAAEVEKIKVLYLLSYQWPVIKVTNREWSTVLVRDENQRTIDYDNPLNNLVVAVEIEKRNYQLPEEYMNALKMLDLLIEA